MCKPMNIIKKASTDRVFLLDEIRGFAILCMVVYHAVYNLVFLFGVDFPFFTSTFMNTIRDIFAGGFIFISGAVCHFSKSNLKRGALCFGLGMVLTVGTLIIIPSELIMFGILHLLGVCMMLYPLVSKLLERIPTALAIILFAILFLLTYNIMCGYLGFKGFVYIDLPNSLYSLNLFPFGMPSTSFFSSDYFPLFPWMFVFFAGTYFGKALKQNKMPKFFYNSHCKPLGAIGRNTLLIYLLHQPIIFGIMELVNYFIYK